jgi:hypothetical protein
MAGKKQYADLDMQSVSRILNLMAPASANEPARWGDVQALLEGLNWKDNVRVKTQGNINLSSPGATIDGVTMVSGDRFLAGNQTTASQNGIYIWNGAASAATRANDASTADELENAIVSVDEGTDAGTTWRQTLVNFTLGSGSIAFTSFGTITPSATESTQGKAEIATQGETDTGTDDVRFLTPLKAKTAIWRTRKVGDVFGDGTATTFVITHGLENRNVVVNVWSSVSPFAAVDCEVRYTDNNTVTLVFNSAPSADGMSYNIVG